MYTMEQRNMCEHIGICPSYLLPLIHSFMFQGSKSCKAIAKLVYCRMIHFPQIYHFTTVHRSEARITTQETLFAMIMVDQLTDLETACSRVKWSKERQALGDDRQTQWSCEAQPSRSLRKSRSEACCSIS